MVGAFITYMASVRLFAQRKARLRKCKCFVEEMTLEREHVESEISGPSSFVKYE
jgi:hypothetical protein